MIQILLVEADPLPLLGQGDSGDLAAGPHLLVDDSEKSRSQA